MLLKIAVQRYAEHAALLYTAVMSTPHAVPPRSQATYNTSHLQLQTSALVLQEPIRSAARGAARASRRALGGVHGRVGIPVGVVNYSARERGIGNGMCTSVWHARFGKSVHVLLDNDPPCVGFQTRLLAGPCELE